MGVSGQYIATSASIADGAVTNSKLAALSVSAAKMAHEGNLGEVLTSNGAGAVPSYQAAGAGSQYLTLIEQKVLDADAVNYTFTGYAAGYKGFLLQYCEKLDNTASIGGLRINGDTGSNYTHGLIYNSSTTVTSLDENGATYAPSTFSNGSANDILTGWVHISNDTPPTGGFKPYLILWSHLNSSGNMVLSGRTQGCWKSTSDITSIVWGGNGATKMKAGSILTLWGLK